jgi:hypothetical protein
MEDDEFGVAEIAAAKLRRLGLAEFLRRSPRFIGKILSARSRGFDAAEQRVLTLSRHTERVADWEREGGVPAGTLGAVAVALSVLVNCLGEEMPRPLRMRDRAPADMLADEIDRLSSCTATN